MQILSIDGGGYLGLATASFIEGVEHHFGCSLADRFQLFCGTSTGAIIALGLAAGKTGAELRQLYCDLGSRVLAPRRGWRARLSPWITPKYDTEPLREALTEVFGDATLADLRAKGKVVVVTSFCLTTGQPRIFKTDHSPNLTRHDGYRIVDVALASAAAPAYFPLVRIRDPLHNVHETFCDGGVVTNQPALVAFAEAVSECAVRPRNIRLLSLSTPRANLAEREPIRTNRGLYHWGEGLANVFIDGSARISAEILKRIVASYSVDERPFYERIELQNPHKLAFDDASAAATEALIHEGSFQASSNEVRRRVAVFFQKEVAYVRDARLSR